MALLLNAVVASGSALGEYRTLSQVDPVAVLLAHGSNDEVNEYSIRWH